MAARVGVPHLAVPREDQTDCGALSMDVQRVAHHRRTERLVSILGGLGDDLRFPLADPDACELE
jgi:hypothetical protein